jgi:hypothetical protein
MSVNIIKVFYVVNRDVFSRNRKKVFISYLNVFLLLTQPFDSVNEFIHNFIYFSPVL